MGGLPSKIGTYRVVRQLGEGGMGTIFEAVHETIERRVAIKVLHPEFARNAEFTARFFNEARAVNRVAHPGLVQVSDYGQQPDGTSYIVMEFLEGESLARRLDRFGGMLSSADVTHLGWQLADSLAAAHEKGITHRDLKPDNVMIVPDPHMHTGERTKLLDFGIAKLDDRGGAPGGVKTRIGQVLGTPTYMSPEQCAGAEGVGEKSDVYSLGVMLFEMLAGRPPFCSDTDANIMRMHLHEDPPSLRQLASAVPPPLADLVHRLLVKDIEARPTMRQTAVALERLADQQPAAKRSASNEAVRAAALVFPDATLRVDQKHPKPAAVADATMLVGRKKPKAVPVADATMLVGRKKPKAVPVPDATMLVGRKRPKPSTLGLSASQTLPKGPRQHRMGIAFAAALGIGGLIALAAWQLPHRTAGPQPRPPVVVSAPHAVPDKRVVLRVESRPEGAQVIRIQDGEVLGQTPWQVTQPAAEGRLQLRLRLPNHEDQDVSVAASVDQQAVVQLVPARPKLDRPGTGDQRKTESNKPAKAKPRTPAGKWETPKIID